MMHVSSRNGSKHANHPKATGAHGQQPAPSSPSYPLYPGSPLTTPQAAFDATALPQFLQHERDLLDSLFSKSSEKPAYYGLWLRCRSFLDDLERAYRLFIQAEALVHDRTRTFQKSRAAHLDAEIAKMQFSVDLLRAALRDTRREAFRLLGRSGIVPSSEVLTPETVQTAVAQAMVANTIQTTAGADTLHAGSDPHSLEAQKQRRRDGIRETGGTIALAAIQAVVFTHGLGLNTIAQIIHLSKPTWLLGMWFSCFWLTFFMGGAVTNAFQTIVRAFPVPTEPTPWFTLPWLPSRAKMGEESGAGRIVVKRFTPGWLAVFLVAGVFLVEAAFITIKADVVVAIQTTTAQHRQGIDGGDSTIVQKQADAPKFLMPASLGFGLALTTVFFLYKASAAVKSEEEQRRYAYFAAEQRKEQQKQGKELLEPLNPLLADGTEYDAELAQKLPILAALEEERRDITRTIPGSYSDLFAQQRDEVIEARQHYMAARDALFLAIQPPSLGAKPSKRWSALSTYWGAIGGWFHRFRRKEQ